MFAKSSFSISALTIHKMNVRTCSHELLHKFAALKNSSHGLLENNSANSAQNIHSARERTALQLGLADWQHRSSCFCAEENKEK